MDRSDSESTLSVVGCEADMKTMRSSVASAARAGRRLELVSQTVSHCGIKKLGSGTSVVYVSHLDELETGFAFFPLVRRRCFRSSIALIS